MDTERPVPTRNGRIGPASRFTFLLLCLWLIAAAPWGAARADTFDLMQFNAPSGTRTPQQDVLVFTDATRTTFINYGVYRSRRSSGNPARDFADEWQSIVASRLRVTGALKTRTLDRPGGWKMTVGSAAVWEQGARNFVSILTVFTGHGVKLSVVVQYNDESARPRINAFLASLRPLPPAGPAARSAATAPDTSGRPSLTSQEWYHSVANYSHWGTHFNAAQIAAINSQGTARWYYRFRPDGSYTFTSEFWSLNRSNDYWFVEESGTWRQDATTLTLRPTRAQRILRDRNGRAQASPQSLPLEPATYRYAFQYLSGMQRWYLVLMPANGRDARRDGSRSNIPDYGPAYRYGQRPHCEQRPKPSDCRG